MKAHEHVILEVARERERQMAVEGWTLEHDDKHSEGEIARAAAAYADHAARSDLNRRWDEIRPPAIWPWAERWWKPTDRRREMVIAAALIVAEIERLDRLSA